MGLDTSHDAWHGPYSCFNTWRRAIAEIVGIDLNSMEGFGGDVRWSALPPDPIHILLNHSDCDGEIAAKDCGPLADRLEQLLPKLEHNSVHPAAGHRHWARQFVRGLRKAAKAKEPVEFA